MTTRPADPAPASTPTPRAVCTACPHRCRLAPGQAGRCRARVGTAGDAGSLLDSDNLPSPSSLPSPGDHPGTPRVICANYGRVTSLALDPVEKKPLACWRPGTYVLSVGSYGCTMACPWCQNHQIAMAGGEDVPWRAVSPEELVAAACDLRTRDPRVAGLAFTYNEPLAGWEYVRDCAALAHEHGLANVLVSNGMTTPEVLRELDGLIDAANIDLKAATPQKYRFLGGDLTCAQQTIETLHGQGCHVEVTTLVVPGFSDAPEDIEALARWIAGVDPALPYHLTRYFPHYRAADKPADPAASAPNASGASGVSGMSGALGAFGAVPTPVADVRRAAAIARRHLERVFVGNC